MNNDDQRNDVVDLHSTITYTKFAPLGLTREKRGWYQPADDYLIGIEFRDTETDLGALRASVNETAKITTSSYKRRIVRFYDDVPLALAFIDRFATLIETVVRAADLTTDNAPSADRRRAVRKAISDYQTKRWEDRQAAQERQAFQARRPDFDTESVYYCSGPIGDAQVSAKTPVAVICSIQNKPLALKKLGAVEVRTWRGSEQRVAFFPSELSGYEAIPRIGGVNTVLRWQTDGLVGDVRILCDRDEAEKLIDLCADDAAILAHGMLVNKDDAALIKIARPDIEQVDLIAQYPPECP